MDSDTNLKMPFTQNEIAQAVGSESSFAFECQVFKRLKYWFEGAKHGGTYIDPVTGIRREFDIRVAQQTTGGNLVNLAVECKKLSVASPVVVLRTMRRTDEKSICEIVPMVPSNQHSSRMPRERTIGRYSSVFVGRSIDQYQRDKKNDIKRVRNAEGVFDKWSQAISSCQEFIENGLRHSSAFRTTIIPVLAIPNSCLWVVDFDDDGNASEPQQVPHCEVYVNVPAGEKGFRITHLEIWTVDAIQERVTSLEP